MLNFWPRSKRKLERNEHAHVPLLFDARYLQMEIPLNANTAFVHSDDSFAVDAEPVTLV